MTAVDAALPRPVRVAGSDVAQARSPILAGLVAAAGYVALSAWLPAAAISRGDEFARCRERPLPTVWASPSLFATETAQPCMRK